MNKNTTIADIITTYGISNIRSAIIRDIGGDRHTGSRSGWIDASGLDLSNPEDTSAEIIRELPDIVFEAADGSFWKVCA